MARTQQKVAKTRGIKCSIHSMICVFIAVLVLGIVYMIGESKKLLDDRRENRNRGRSLSQCNLFSGKWVYDNKSYPLYREQHCLYQFDGVACEKDGRKDLNYQHWRWQPHDCDLPRFNAIAMLERLRGRRLVFVGDSITRNQWASMVCLLESFIPPALKSVNSSGSLAIFKVTEYNASIEHYWSPFLVESSSDHPMNHHFSSKQIVRVQEIENHARHWTDADILVFNSYIWWRKPKLKALWGSFDGVYKEVDMPRGYEMALKTWLDGLDIHVNRTRTKLYFVSNSPTHERGEKWGRSSGENCYNEKEPILEEGYEGSESDPEMMQKVEAAINELSRRGLKVQLLNITRLSEYRKDGHTSIYRKQWRRVTRQQLANPSSYADCVNWCNPGVPDVWNELLYAYMFYF
ncbi:protein trichome birefringence-like 34 [Camellia sinensis]|nr:protein trichome birefringence-like 34 [Camellia sinensis]